MSLNLFLVIFTHMRPQIGHESAHKVFHGDVTAMTLAEGRPCIDNAVHDDGPDVVALPILTLFILDFIPKLIKLIEGLVGLGVVGSDETRGAAGTGSRTSASMRTLAQVSESALISRVFFAILSINFCLLPDF